MKRRPDGFTLIEIMIGVGIIGLLAAMASVSISKSVKKKNINKAKTDVEILSSAVLQLAWDTGRWPNQMIRTDPKSAEVWDISSDAAGLMGTDGSYSGWNGPYYEGSVLDLWGNPYFFDPDYTYEGEIVITVGSFGPNGKGRNAYDDDDILPDVPDLR